ncbi:MAG: hypothetical protein Q8R44_19495 [Novosphingobium sp.]|nr:hypothetical protein [Novosphingobium sp.]
MPSYLEMPEAIDFIAGQAWLSPTEPASAAPRASPRRMPPPLHWREALREMAAILKRMRPT